MKPIKHEELLEDGSKKISMYDAESHNLLSYYHVNSNGKKLGQEIEYDESGLVIADRTYENGKCVKSKEVLPISAILEFLQKNTMATRCVGFDYVKVATVTKENDQYKHISIRRGPAYFYDMEFKDNKEYNGVCKTHESNLYGGYLRTRYGYKNGLPDGNIEINDHYGTYTDGQFTGKKYISQQNSLSLKTYMELREEEPLASCWQMIENDKVVSEHLDYDRYSLQLNIPYNGEAIFYKRNRIGAGTSTLWTCEMKDGVKNGKCKNHENCTISTYVDGVLEGPCVEYYDRHMTLSSNVKAKYSYKQGKINGPYTEFFKSYKKTKKIEGFYKDGKKNGVWKYYNEQGKVINTEFWKDGKNETEKFNAIKKVAAKHIDDKEPTNKIEKVTKKSVKVLEIALETAKSKIQKH